MLWFEFCNSEKTYYNVHFSLVNQARASGEREGAERRTQWSDPMHTMVRVLDGSHTLFLKTNQLLCLGQKLGEQRVRGAAADSTTCSGSATHPRCRLCRSGLLLGGLPCSKVRAIQVVHSVVEAGNLRAHVLSRTLLEQRTAVRVRSGTLWVILRTVAVVRTSRHSIALFAAARR